MFSWMRMEPGGPVTDVDDGDRLLRYAHCDGSVDPGGRTPRDLTRTGVLRAVVPPGAVVCMATAWALHTGTATLSLDLVGDMGDAVAGTRTFPLAVRECELTVIGSVRCTTLVRTVFDLACLAPLEVAAQALVDAREWVSRSDFAELLEVHAAAPGAARAGHLRSMVWRAAASGCR